MNSYHISSHTKTEVIFMKEKINEKKSGKIGLNMSQINTMQATGQWDKTKQLKLQEDRNERDKSK
ncbi:MAG: hypothetical protein FH753_04890 [Firmicutes bacterium]|nr:hypothetical protein [Bacillota bacterium]